MCVFILTVDKFPTCEKLLAVLSMQSDSSLVLKRASFSPSLDLKIWNGHRVYPLLSPKNFDDSDLRSASTLISRLICWLRPMRKLDNSCFVLKWFFFFSFNRTITFLCLLYRKPFKVNNGKGLQYYVVSSNRNLMLICHYT